MKIVTFYADCSLPPKAQSNQSGFDWRKAMGWLRKSAAKQGYETVVVSDDVTDIAADIRIGNAKDSGLMLWILQAQAEAIRQAQGPSVMVSPDSLVKGPLDCLFGDWDLVLLTRTKPKPIVNSVIGFLPSEQLYSMWLAMTEHAKSLPPASLTWGADIDALVSYMKIQPSENSVRTIDDVKVCFMPMFHVFTSFSSGQSPKTPIWDFKGPRKKFMEMCAK